MFPCWTVITDLLSLYALGSFSFTKFSFKSSHMSLVVTMHFTMFLISFYIALTRHPRSIALHGFQFMASLDLLPEWGLNCQRIQFYFWKITWWSCHLSNHCSLCRLRSCHRWNLALDYRTMWGNGMRHIDEFFSGS